MRQNTRTLARRRRARAHRAQRSPCAALAGAAARTRQSLAPRPGPRRAQPPRRRPAPPAPSAAEPTIHCAPAWPCAAASPQKPRRFGGAVARHRERARAGEVAELALRVGRALRGRAPQEPPLHVGLVVRRARVVKVAATAVVLRVSVARAAAKSNSQSAATAATSCATPAEHARRARLAFAAAGRHHRATNTLSSASRQARLSCARRRGEGARDI